MILVMILLVKYINLYHKTYVILVVFKNTKTPCYDELGVKYRCSLPSCVVTGCF